MDTDRRAMLQKIVNDSCSTPEERSQGLWELDHEPSEQDEILERYLADEDFTRDEWDALPLEAKELCLSFANPRLGIVDTSEESLDRLIGLYRRTGSERVRNAVLGSVRAIAEELRNSLLPDNRKKFDAFICQDGYDQLLVRRHFIESGSWPGVERLEHRAAAFLEAHD